MTSPRNETPAELATGSNAPRAAERTLERAVGSQIRTLRRRNELSVSDLASAAGISAGMLSKIENGQISPSLTSLQSLANALAVPLTTLFAAFEQQRDVSFVAAGEGAILERRGTKAGHLYQLLGSIMDVDVVVEPYLITLQEDAVPYTGFQHAGAEFIYMLSGEVTYRHGERTFPLRSGDSLLFNSGAPHGPETLLSVPSTYLSIIIYPQPTI